MTAEELNEIFDNQDKKFSIEELKEVFIGLQEYCNNRQKEIKNDYMKGEITHDKAITTIYFCAGEVNALQRVLNLLERLDSDKTEV